MPATKPLRSGTCAITLLAMITSARRPSAAARAASSAPKNSASVGMPASLAAAAWSGAGSMPSTGTPVLDEVAQQVAVVAGELDDEAVRPEAAVARSGPARARARASRLVRERREVEVVVDEQLLRRHLLEDLHERAVGQKRRRAGSAARGRRARSARRGVGQRQSRRGEERPRGAVGAAGAAVVSASARLPSSAGRRRAGPSSMQLLSRRLMRRKRSLVEVLEREPDAPGSAVVELARCRAAPSTCGWKAGSASASLSQLTR